MGSKSRFQKCIQRGIADQIAIKKGYYSKKTFQIQSIASYDTGVEFLERNQDLAAAKHFKMRLIMILLFLKHGAI